MPQDTSDYYRFCPNQPGILLSDAVCLGRRRVSYPHCAMCSFNDDKTQAPSASRPPTGAADAGQKDEAQDTGQSGEEPS